jgi:uncharacterized repeat protein (TIGR03803 family)
MKTLLHFSGKGQNTSETTSIFKKASHLFTVLFMFCIFLTSKAQMTTLLAFTGSVSPSYGGNPQGNLYYDGTYLYGLTAVGGKNNLGVLFKIQTNGSNYDTLINFRGTANGQSPHGSLISDGNFLYGQTQYGGTGNAGTTFRILPNGNGYFKMYDFNGTTEGKAPFGSLYYDGTFLYGMPQVGGTNNLGTIYKIKPAGAYANGYARLTDFTGTSGAVPTGEPEATLISDGTSLYALGAIFKINPNTLVFDTLLSFSGTANGSYPTNALIFDGTYLYGMTESGGTNNLGTIFKILPNGTGYVKLVDFAGISNGSVPHGGLYDDGTFLYGTASGGGANGFGILFRMKKNGTGFTDLYDFDGAAHGKAPRGDLVSDGTCLYGMTVTGGTNNLGVVFKYQYCTLPVVTANASAAAVCSGNTVTLSGSGANSYTWTSGVANGIAFVPGATATYTVTGRDTATGCKNTDVKTITVNTTLVVSLIAAGNTLCVNNAAVNLTGTPAGGVYSGTGVSGNNFDPAVSGVGAFTINYNYTDVNGCSGKDSTMIQVNGCAGVNANKSKNFNIAYPNPFTNAITVTSQTEGNLITIYNSLGEIIYQGRTNGMKFQIDLSKQPAGIYFLEAQNSYIKIIKE